MKMKKILAATLAATMVMASALTASATTRSSGRFNPDVKYAIDRESCRNTSGFLINGRVDMQESALLSVIIPIYNGELYLEQTIESILQASWKELDYC